MVCFLPIADRTLTGERVSTNPGIQFPITMPKQAVLKLSKNSV